MKIQINDNMKMKISTKGVEEFNLDFSERDLQTHYHTYSVWPVVINFAD